MNSTQIKYIRKALYKRKRVMMSNFSNMLQEPHEVACARVTIEQWQKKRAQAYSTYEAEVNTRIQNLEEQAILGGAYNDIRKELQALDAEHDPTHQLRQLRRRP